MPHVCWCHHHAKLYWRRLNDPSNDIAIVRNHDKAANRISRLIGIIRTDDHQRVTESSTLCVSDAKQTKSTGRVRVVAERRLNMMHRCASHERMRIGARRTEATTETQVQTLILRSDLSDQHDPLSVRVKEVRHSSAVR